MSRDDMSEESWTVREILLNFDKIISYLLVLIAGISKSDFLLNLVLIILTSAIIFIGYIASKTKKAE